MAITKESDAVSTRIAIIGCGGIEAVQTEAGVKSWSNRCILGVSGDLVFFVAMPLLVLGVFAAAAAAGKAEILAAVVMTSMSLGHHFPGFLRVYTDPELFSRFRLRFIAIPLLLAMAVGTLAVYDLKGLLLILFFWGVWHGLMQVYGFARIYDAKIGDTSRLSARLDWFLCLFWFVTLTLSSFREVNLRLYCDQVGLGFLAELLLAQPLTNALLAATTIVTGVFLGHVVWRLATARPVNPLKLLMLATTLLLLFVSYRNFSKNPLVSIAMFEAYHDVQYFAIVWSFGRKQSDRKALRAVGNFLFRPRMALLYVVLIFLYGSLDSPLRYVSEGQLLRQLTTLVSVSTFLHFYFDGFIWKLRKRTIQVQPEGMPAAVGENPRSGFMDLVVQCALIGAPIALLVIFQTHRSRFELPALRLISQFVPPTAESEFVNAKLSARYGDTESAIRAYRAAVAAKPDFKDAWYNLGVLLLKTGDRQAAEVAFQKTIWADPNYPFGYLQLAMLRQNAGQMTDGIVVLENAAKRLPDNPTVLSALASALATAPSRSETDSGRAISLAERACSVATGDALCESLATLAFVYQTVGRSVDAKNAAQDALRLSAQSKNPDLKRRIAATVAPMAMAQ